MVEASLVNIVELGVLVVGVVIALQQLRDIKQTRETELETRQAQLFMELYNRYSTKEFRQQALTVRNIYSWTDYEDFMSKYGLENNPDAYSNISSLFHISTG